jgi:hypothetical protein
MRILVGLILMVSLDIGLGFALDLHRTVADSAEHASPPFATALLGLVAAACGAVVARQGWFVPIAVAVDALLWAKALYHLHRLPFGSTYPDLIASNAVPIVISLVAVGVGALFGGSLVRPRRPVPAR